MYLPDFLQLPIEIHKQIPFTKGMLNGKECTFLIDTGSPHVLLNSAHVSPETLNEGKELQGAAGKIKSFRSQIGELSFGPWKMGPMEILAVDESHLESYCEVSFEGSLGFRELIHYTYWLDYGKQELNLSLSFRPEEHEILAQSPISFRNHLVILSLSTQGQTFSFALDTGCSGIVVDMDQKETFLGFLEELETDVLIGAGGKSHEVEKGILPEFQVAGQTFTRAELGFADLAPLKQRIGYFDGIVGYPLLSQIKTAISWERKMLYFLK